MSMLKEFKEFAIKGNMVDMAVGLIIGVAFKGVVSSFVKDVIMPPIGQMLGGVNFSDLYINLSQTAYESLALATKAGAPVIRYGVFVQTVIDFIIIAFVVFMMVKMINNMKKKEEATPAAPAAPSKEEVLLTDIRDALKK